jgi:hypothetical protein
MESSKKSSCHGTKHGNSGHAKVALQGVMTPCRGGVKGGLAGVRPPSTLRPPQEITTMTISICARTKPNTVQKIAHLPSTHVDGMTDHWSLVIFHFLSYLIRYRSRVWVSLPPLDTAADVALCLSASRGSRVLWRWLLNCWSFGRYS